MLSGKAVLLEQPKKNTSKVISHVLTSHAGVCVGVCMCTHVPAYVSVCTCVSVSILHKSFKGIVETLLMYTVFP